jgi:serralysin
MPGTYIDEPALGHNTSLTQDVLYGLDGRDQLLSSEATLYAEGGRGNDFIGIVDNPTGTVEAYGGQGADTIFGRGGSLDKLYGGEDGDFLLGTTADVASDGTVTAKEASGADDMEGGAGDDALYGFDGNDELYGGGGNDKGTILVPHSESFTTDTYQSVKAGLFGGDGDDLVHGGGGDDDVHGGNGDDLLWGDAGADRFFFDTALNASSNVDKLKDFSHGDGDRIVLSHEIFDEIGTSLSKKEFVVGKKAHDGNDVLIYNQKKGLLLYDDDGKGGDKGVLFATVEKGHVLSDSDFLIV